jgi:hypothetical protein
MITATNTEMTSAPKPKKRNSFWRKAGKWLSGIGKGIKSLFNKSTGADLTSAERQTMDWNAEQAELNRSFQSAEAEKARQWQEDYYNAYESPQARIRQYEDAGLNPALLYGSQLGSGSAPSTSVPAGDSASVGMPSSGAGDLLSFIGEMMSIKSLVNNYNAGADAKRAEAENKRADTKLKEQQYEFNPELWRSEINKNEANTKNLLAGVEQLQASTASIFKDIDLKDSQIDEIIARTDNIRVDTAKKELEKQGVEVNNRLLAAKILETYANARLAKAKELLAGSEKDLTDKKAFRQQLENDDWQSSGGRPVDSFAGLVDKGANILGKGLSDLWDWLF